MITVPHESNGDPELAGSVTRCLGCAGRYMVTDAITAIDTDQSIVAAHLRP
jgi:hypothetical protein